MNFESEDLTYLGLDLSTQQLKAVVLNNKLEILSECYVQFDNDLPEFRTHGGVHRNKFDSNIVTAPVLMWVKALDILFDKLTICGVDFSKIAAISGTAQQHGSVYWQKGSGKTLANLDSNKFLHEQLLNSFILNESPIWMDSSTKEQCKLLEDTVGGPEKLAQITGSKAYERFTGNQIAKLNHQKPEIYKNTEKISLVSSFVCSIFLGQYAPIDYSDGSGMNLLNIHEKKWDHNLLRACGDEELLNKLGEPVPSNSIVGKISKYYVERFGFEENCQIVAFTGDNPASLIGMRLEENCLAVSLGTSDTLFLWLNEPKIVLEGHILCNPINPKAYMAMLCFKNGSLTREKIRDQFAEGSWQLFNELLNSTPRGNFGNIGLYYDLEEIIPPFKGEFRFNKDNNIVSKFASLEVEVRAVIEGQFLRTRSCIEDMGVQLGPETKILATGGASINKNILQVLADIFNCPVYSLEEKNSACVGAAIQAKHGLLKDNISFKEITSSLPPPKLVCKPFKDSSDVYDPMLQRYRKIIEKLLKSS